MAQDFCSFSTTAMMQEVETRQEQRLRAPKVGALGDAGAVCRGVKNGQKDQQVGVPFVENHLSLIVGI